jgi:hypothetical protein
MSYNPQPSLLQENKLVFQKRGYHLFLFTKIVKKECILCTYAYFKSGLSIAHLTVAHFFIDEPSNHPLIDLIMSYEKWEGPSVKKIKHY